MGYQLKFEKYSGPAYRAYTDIVQLCHEMPDFNYSAQPGTS